MAAVQLKLDELIRGLSDARSHLIGLEHLSDEELAEVAQEFARLREEHAPRRPQLPTSSPPPSAR
jgi:low affinity Fe/Cu permease